MSNEVLMCEVCPELPTQMHYKWPWDRDWKPCSSRGQMLLRQKAERLKRPVEFLPLVESDPARLPLERTERHQLHAARLAAEDELKEARDRSTRLYNQTVELTADIKTLRNEAEQAKAQLLAKIEEVEQGYAERARLSRENGDFQLQLQAANRLLQSSNAPTEELQSVKKQFEDLQTFAQNVEHTLNVEREKHGLRVAELQRELTSERETNDRLRAAIMESDKQLLAMNEELLTLKQEN